MMLFKDISQVVISVESKDELVWWLNSRGISTVKCCYLHLARGEGMCEKLLSMMVWKVKAKPRVVFFFLLGKR